MKVGVPAEVKNHEYCVAITPAGVHELVINGHEVSVQAGPGVGSSISDSRVPSRWGVDPRHGRRGVGRGRDSVFYCVANIPGSVPNTPTCARTNVTLPYVVALANKAGARQVRTTPASHSASTPTAGC
ncbi:hypothetical protein [Saccharopolyspora pogona]|uniref:hypothetical protein n=1 Tax=Saccharopolyspora pogona TaxID=333966 RepID=UPI0037CA3E5A